MAVLELKDILKEIDGKTILKNINFRISENQLVGIKCTKKESRILFDLIENVVLATRGTIDSSFKHILSDRKKDDLYKSMTVGGYLKYFNKLAGNHDNLDSLKSQFSLKDSWHLPIKKTTLAQQKRISLMRLFLFRPDLILIESPLTDLDDEGIELYLKCIQFFKENKTSIIFTASYLEELFLLSNNIYINSLGGLEKLEILEEKNQSSEVTNVDVNPAVFKIACKIDDKIILFSPKEIDYIESINSVSQIQIGGESFLSNLTMREMESRLSKFGFFRCHRSYLVNLQIVRELISYSKNNYTLVLANSLQSKIPLSRTRLEELKELLDI